VVKAVFVALGVKDVPIKKVRRVGATTHATTVTKKSILTHFFFIFFYEKKNKKNIWEKTLDVN
jgi:hypothetical protein